MPNKMLIDASHPEETRVVVTRGNRIEEFDFESQDKKQLRGNIYLARVTRVEPSLQAAFVEYGGNRHGFLAFSEIHPDYYQIPIADRQAILRAEAEAAEAEDDEDNEGRQERSRANGGRRNKRRGRNRSRGPEGNRSEADGGEANAASEGFGELNADSEATDHADVEAASEDGDNGGSTRSIPAEVSADVISEAVETETAAEERHADDDRHAQADDDAADKVDDRDPIESVGAGDAMDEVRDRRRPVRRHYKIQEVIKRRQILLVQVVKEERGNKGAALTTYLSLAGRYSVLMPNTARGGGISRKITSALDRKRLKDVVKDLDVPQGMGVILRTAGENRTKAEIKRDYEYLMRLWENVRNLTLQSTAPTLVYEEGSLIKRSVRDLYNKDIEEILVAGEDGYREAKDFMRMLMPSHAKMVQPYRDTTPIFARNGIEAQLDRMVQPQVTLKSGGYIIINQTEALVSIDVNSGRSTREHSIEDTALQTNLEAAEEVARQLRLRDLAGLIVIDFIDMEEGRNNRAVEKRIKDCLKNDRARIQVGRISHFGLLEMSRQRIRASVLESTMKVCQHCGGTGHVRSDSSVALLVVRAIEEFLLKDNRHHITVHTPAATALYVLNHKRGTLVALEQKFGLAITLEADDSVGAQHYTIFRGAAVEKPIDIVEAAPLPLVEEDDHDEVIVEAEDDEVDAAETDAKAGTETRPEAKGDTDANRKRKRRRRRRGGRDREQPSGADSAIAQMDAGEVPTDDDDTGDTDAGDDKTAVATTDDVAAVAKKRRRGKRGGKRNREDGELEAGSAEATAEVDIVVETTPTDETAAPPAEEVAAPVKKPRRTAKAKKADTDGVEALASAPAKKASKATPKDEPVAAADEEPAPSRRPSRRASEAASAPTEPKVSSTAGNDAEPPAPKKGWWQRKSFF